VSLASAALAVSVQFCFKSITLIPGTLVIEDLRVPR
jgi:hypothetical protein